MESAASADERHELTQTMEKKDKENSVPIPLFMPRISGKFRGPVWIWSGSVLILCLIFFLVRPQNNLVICLFLGANAGGIVWYLWMLTRIKRSVGEFSSLVSQTRDMIWRLDSDLLITGIWGAVLPVTGREADELLGRPFTDFFSRETAREFTGCIRLKHPFSMAAGIRRPHGGDLDVEISAMPVSGKASWQGIIRNVSELKRHEEAVRTLKVKLADAEKLKNLGILAGSVAHDLNNILSGIATYPEVLLLDDTLDHKVKKGLAMIRDSGRKASSVVSDLLTISRGVKADKQILNINTVVERYLAAAEFWKIKQTYDQVKIEVITEPELLNINGSYIHIEKAVMNLVLNAVEETATRPGGKVVLSTANYYVEKVPEETIPVDDVPGTACPPDLAPGEYVVLQVQDNGAGIPEDCLARIFEPFFTQKEMGKSGTGLGLTVVLNAAQDHNGIVHVNSSSRGTRFDLYFPAIRAELPKRDALGSMDEIRGRGETLLIVDDLASQRKIAATILKSLGYRVFTVADGLAAIDFVKENPVDLLVLDMIMAPSISGLETYERIKRIYPDQKAIIASGHSESEDVLKAQELGAGSFVKKPYTILDMGIAVKEELER